MLKGARRPVTYGKPTKRYMLSDSRAESPTTQVWHEPSSGSHDSSPSAVDAEQRIGQARESEFDVPSSDSEPQAARLLRPPKKRKITPPEQRLLPARQLPRPMKQRQGFDHAQQFGPPRKTEVSTADDFEVPSSDDEIRRSHRKSAPKLSASRQVGQLSSSATRRPAVQGRVRRDQGRPGSAKWCSEPANRTGAPDLLSTTGHGKKLERHRQSELIYEDPEITSSSTPTAQEANGKRVLMSPQPTKRRFEPKPTSFTSTVPRHGHDLSQRSGFGHPSTPPAHEDSDDPISPTPQQDLHVPQITPGALNLTDLSVQDHGTYVVAMSAPKPAAYIISSDTSNKVHRKLKDRLGQAPPDREASLVGSSHLEPLTIHAQDLAQGESVSDIGPPRSHRSASRVGVIEPLTGRRKFTYGRQRSHLSEAELDEAAAWSVPLDDALYQSPTRRLKLAEPRDLAKVPQAMQEPSDDEDTGLEKPLRNVHELRAAGEARRTGFMLDSFFDDVQAASTTGSARGAMFRLAFKLMEPSSPTEFVRHGSLSRLCSLEVFNSDLFIISVYAMSSIQVLPLAPTAEFGAQPQVLSLLQYCSSLLGEDNALVKTGKLRASNMSKSHQTDLIEICRLASQQPSWAGIDYQLMTPRLIGLKALDICIRRLRQAGDMRQLVDSHVFDRIGEVLLTLSEDTPTIGTAGTEHGLTLSVLESLSTGDFLRTRAEEISNTNTGIRNVALSLPYILNSSKDLDNDKTSLALRLCLNVTTKYSAACRSFADSKVIASVTAMLSRAFAETEAPIGVGQQDLVVDHMVLGLGFLTNLTEELGECRLTFLKATTDGKSCLQTLLAIFQAKHERAAIAVTEFETKVNVAFGYIAVLLCSLCLDDGIRRYVALELKDKALIKLREAMAQFIIFHQSIDMDVDSNADTANPQVLFVERLQQVLSALGAACKGE